MASGNKLMQNAYKNEPPTSEEESYDDTDYNPRIKQEVLPKKNTIKIRRKPKCFSKNALVARENRLKKKKYITNLENNVVSLRNENTKLSTIVDNQSFLISDLKRQLKYFKSIIANSSDISKLIRNIHQNTGMSVSSSLDRNLSLKNVCVPKPIARKTAHPWEETDCASYPTPEYNLSSSDTLEADEITEVLSDFPLDIMEHDLLDSNVFEDKNIEINSLDTLSEHNYTTTLPKEVFKFEEDLDDVGVCLHVSKHKVSLEFCPTCSENAASAWID